MYNLDFFIHVKEIFVVGVQPKTLFAFTMYNMECYNFLSMAGHCEDVDVLVLAKSRFYLHKSLYFRPYLFIIS